MINYTGQDLVDHATDRVLEEITLLKVQEALASSDFAPIAVAQMIGEAVVITVQSVLNDLTEDDWHD